MNVPPRPPLPNAEDYYNLNVKESYQPETLARTINLKKNKGSFGFRIIGGNNFGVFVSAVLPSSAAFLKGLQTGDKILKINGRKMSGFTREEIALISNSLPNHLELLLQYSKTEFDKMMASKEFDSFHIKTNFNYGKNNKGSFDFKQGDIFYVINTLYKGKFGSWLVYRIDQNNNKIKKELIPSMSRAEKIHEIDIKKSTGFLERIFKYKKRPKETKFTAYERVILMNPNFMRPLIFFGPLTDILVKKLITDYSQRFEIFHTGKEQQKFDKLFEKMFLGKHQILNVKPDVAENLVSKNYYPIIVFLSTTKNILKNFGKSYERRNCKKLFKESKDIEKKFDHIFTVKIEINENNQNNWCGKLRKVIKKQQNTPIYINEKIIKQSKLTNKSNKSRKESLLTTEKSQSEAIKSKPKRDKCENYPNYPNPNQLSMKRNHFDPTQITPMKNSYINFHLTPREQIYYNCYAEPRFQPAYTINEHYLGIV